MSHIAFYSMFDYGDKIFHWFKVYLFSSEIYIDTDCSVFVVDSVCVHISDNFLNTVIIAVVVVAIIGCTVIGCRICSLVEEGNMKIFWFVGGHVF